MMGSGSGRCRLVASYCQFRAILVYKNNLNTNPAHVTASPVQCPPASGMARKALLEALWSFRSAHCYSTIACRLFPLSAPKRVGPQKQQTQLFKSLKHTQVLASGIFLCPGSRIIACTDRFQHELVVSQNRKCKQLPGLR